MWGDLAAAVHSQRHVDPPAGHSQLGYQMDAVMSAQTTGWTDPMSLPPVYAAVRLICSTITQLPVTVVGGDTPTWLRRPRRYGSALDLFDIVQAMVASMAVRGAGYLRCIRIGESWRIDAVDARHVGFVQPPGPILDRRYTVDGQDIDVVPPSPLDAVPGRAYLLPIPYLVTPDHPEGTSPLTAATAALAGYADTERQASTLLAGGTYSGGRLETDHDITASSAEAYQSRWMENRRAGRIPVLGNGLRYLNDVIRPVDAQFIESRAFNAMQVFQMFGIPPALLGTSMMGGQSSLSYANAQDNAGLYRRNCLAAFTAQIEDALSTLLPPGRDAAEDVRVAFDYTKWEGEADASSDDPA